MPDPTNDIDALIEFLATASQEPFYYTATHNAEKYHAALTALVAERNALKERVAKLESQPPAASDLRERLVCAALTGILAHEGRGQRFVVEDAVWYAANTLAAMRKGDSDA